jgi:valyl-tRNA synthetase
MLHPILPFVTEEIWHALPGVRTTDSIMQADYPVEPIMITAENAVADMELVMDVIRAIRNIRGELNVPPGKKIKVVLDCKSEHAVQAIKTGWAYITSLARVENLLVGVAIERPEQASTQVAGEIEVLIPLADLIDVAEEKARLSKEIEKVRKDVDFFTKKLSNKKFVANAPPQILEKDREKLAAAKEKREILEQSLRRILDLN